MQLKGCDASVDPSLCLRSAFAVGSLLLRFSFASSPLQVRSYKMGLTWESQGRKKGVTRNLTTNISN